MCGIAGFWGGYSLTASIGEAMAERVESRGPDDYGVWQNADANLVLAHRRLSIVDLSPAGHQPMHSSCGRYTIVYNGEIYNHHEIRSELVSEGVNIEWHGRSDTETLLAGLSHWGVKSTLERLNGMFAFALWDSLKQTLVLARDRLGEKPLYYGRSGTAFIFGSELKALMAHPEWSGEINRDALALYMRHSYVPSPWSIYKGICKLPPAHFITIREGGCNVGEPVCYWELGKIAEKGIEANVGEPAELIEELDNLLRDAIRLRMAADVPLGALLSGGYDSTMVAALMQAQSDRPIKTFTIGFYEEGYNEALHAKAVAEHLGTDHTELYVTPEEAMGVIPKLSAMYDEPFSDSSQIPTFLVSQLARKDVKVCLSGDGGDELFYGYRRYYRANSFWSVVDRVPLPLRRISALLASKVPVRGLEKLMELLPRRFWIDRFGDRFSKFIEIINCSDAQSFYRLFVSHAEEPEKLVLGASEPHTIFSQPEFMPQLPSLAERMMYLDTMTYLPDDILTKVDRASMAVGLEARVPLLDHRLVEFAWRVPTKYKYRSGEGKWLLRQALYRYIPKVLMDRPKMGFGVPIEQWLRGPLKEWAEELLGEKRLRDEGFFDPAAVRRMWEEHTSGKGRWHYHLWDVLMFQAWLENHRNW